MQSANGILGENGSTSCNTTVSNHEFLISARYPVVENRRFATPDSDGTTSTIRTDELVCPPPLTSNDTVLAMTPKDSSLGKSSILCNTNVANLDSLILGGDPVVENRNSLTYDFDSTAPITSEEDRHLEYMCPRPQISDDTVLVKTQKDSLLENTSTSTLSNTTVTNHDSLIVAGDSVVENCISLTYDSDSSVSTTSEEDRRYEGICPRPPTSDDTLLAMTQKDSLLEKSSTSTLSNTTIANHDSLIVAGDSVVENRSSLTYDSDSTASTTSEEDRLYESICPRPLTSDDTLLAMTQKVSLLEKISTLYNTTVTNHGSHIVAGDPMIEKHNYLTYDSDSIASTTSEEDTCCEHKYPRPPTSDDTMLTKTEKDSLLEQGNLEKYETKKQPKISKAEKKR